LVLRWPLSSKKLSQHIIITTKNEVFENDFRLFLEKSHHLMMGLILMKLNGLTI